MNCILRLISLLACYTGLGEDLEMPTTHILRNFRESYACIRSLIRNRSASEI